MMLSSIIGAGRRRGVAAAGGGGWTPGYSLPSTTNTSVWVGTNASVDIKTADHTNQRWDLALFNSYGSPIFVPTWSQGGGIVFSCFGGHNDPSMIDAVIFDMEDVTWKRVANGNNAGITDGPFPNADTTGSPWNEIAVSAQCPSVTGNMPSPPHPYLNLQYLNEGNKGSVIWVTRGSVDGGGSLNSGAAHKQDLETGVWSRVGTGQSTIYGLQGCGVYCPTDNRYYIVPDNLHSYLNISYLRMSDSTWQVTSPNFGSFPGTPGSGPYRSAFIVDSQRALLYHREGALQGIDLTDFGAGVATLSFSGTSPADGHRWVRHEGNGKYYTRVADSGNTLNCFDPGADVLGGTGAFSTITVGGDGLPSRDGTHGTPFFSPIHYVAAIDMLVCLHSGAAGECAIIKV